MSSSRRKMLFNPEQNKDPDNNNNNNNNNNNKFYIFKEGQIINGELIGKTKNIITDNCIYVIGTITKVLADGPTTYVFPVAKGYTSAQSVVDYYKSQDYDISLDDIKMSEDQTYFIPSLEKYQTYETVNGGSVGFHDYELKKYKSINFNIVDLKDRGSSSLALAKSLNNNKTSPGGISSNIIKEIGEIQEGKNSFPLTDVEEYSIIYFKCSYIGNPVYKITEIYLEE